MNTILRLPKWAVLTILFYGCFSSGLSAQSMPCGTEEAVTILGPGNPLNCSDESTCTNGYTGIYKIPVVVHIIHNNGSENISDAQVIEAIKQLNENFRKTAGTPGFGGGVDTQIEFALAKKDPSGNCTSGIDRVQSTKTNVAFYSYTEDAALKNLSRWDQARYLNIWVVKTISGSTAGYAFQPHNVFFNASLEILDGVVIEHNVFGRSGTAAGNGTKTLTHEVGHYLGLYHVWGKDSGQAANCHTAAECLSKGDKVCDTEPCYAALVGGLCEPLDNGCNSTPPVNYPKENYMSYVHSCQERFTADQSTRMHCALLNCRPALWSPANLVCSGAEGYYGENIMIDASTVNSSDPKTTIWNTTNLPNGGEISVSGNLTIKSGYKLIIQPGWWYTSALREN